MPGLTDVAEMIRGIGVAAQLTASEVREARTEVDRLGEAQGKSTTAGISKGSSGGSLSIESADLGDPRDATEQAARMIASIRNATGR